MVSLILRKKYYFHKIFIILLLIFALLFSSAPFPFQQNNVAKAATSTTSTAAAIKSDPVEVIEKRTEKSKSFDNGDGTFTMHLYTTPIHYKDNGVWKDIDTKIKQSGDGNYENSADRFKARFGAKSKTSDLTTFEYDGTKVSYSLTDPQLNDITPVIEDNKITYNDILPDTNLRQVIVNKGIKEDIILKKYNGKNIFNFDLKLAGVEAVKEADGSIGFYKNGQPKKEKIYKIPKPFMVDSNVNQELGEGIKSDYVNIDVLQNGSNFKVTISADENWLKAPERVYPVYVDPTTVLSNTTDVFINDVYPNQSFDANWNTEGYYQLKCGYYDSTTGTNLTYLEIDPSSIDNKLINSAALKLWTAHSYYSTTYTPVWLDTITTNWSPSTISWNNKPGNLGLTSTSTVKNTWASFDVTQAVGRWASYHNSVNYYGFLIHENANGTAYWKKFYASENSTNRPYLEVNYSDPPSAPVTEAYGYMANGSQGYVNLAWNAVPGATGYYVYIFNGEDYEEFDVGNTTNWSTYYKFIWPTADEIQAGDYTLHHGGAGSELSDNPSLVYRLAKTGFNSSGYYNDKQNYWFRVGAYNAFGDTIYSEAATPIIPDRTAPPSVPSVTYSIADTSTNNNAITASWMGVNDSVNGTGSGTKSYKVELVKNDLKTNVSTISSATVAHTGIFNYYYTFTGLPDSTGYSVKVSTYDNNGNYSNPTASSNITNTESGTSLSTGSFYDTEYNNGLKLILPGTPTFTRPSNNYKKDGTLAVPNEPRFDNGKYGQGLLIEESVSNIIPSYPSNWFTANNVNMTAQNIGFQSGIAGNVIHLSNAGTWAGFWVSPGFGLKPNTQYTLKFKARGTIGKGTLDAFVLSNTGSLIQLNGNIFPVTYDWTPSATNWSTVYATFTTTGDIYGSNQYIRFDHNGNDSGYIDIAEVSLIERPYPLSFPGYGATTANENLRIPTDKVFNKAEGTVELTAYIDPLGVHSAKSQSWNMLFSVLNLQTSPWSEKNQISIRHIPGTTTWEAFFSNNNGDMATINLGDITTPGWHRFAVKWKETVGGFAYLDGKPKGSVSAYNLPSSFDSSTGSVAYIGSWVQGNLNANTVIDDFRVSGRAREDYEILSDAISSVGYNLDKDTKYYMAFDDGLVAGKAGYRESLPYSIANMSHQPSYVKWDSSLDYVGIETNLSLDDGVTWQGWRGVSNGQLIPGITYTTDLSHAKVKLREIIISGNLVFTPVLNKVVISQDSWNSSDRIGPTVNITTPANNGFVHGLVDIKGKAFDNSALDYYKVEIGQGVEPTSWTSLNISIVEYLIDGSLALWDTNGLSGPYTIKLTAKDKAGDSSEIKNVINVDNTVPFGSISAPVDNSSVNGTVDIIGTADDVNFDNYKVEYGLGVNPTSWNQIKTSTTPVTVEGTLASWDTGTLADGLYCIKLTVTDKAGNMQTQTIKVNKVASTIVSISNMVDGNFVKGTASITGSALGINFHDYKLEYENSSNPNVWNMINNSTNQMKDGELGVWDTTALTDGTYNLRLTLTDTFNQQQVYNVNGVIVDNTSPISSIANPLDNAVVGGTVSVSGTASDNNFDSAKLEYGEGPVPLLWNSIATITSPVTNSSLANWNVKNLPDGTYTLKLTVKDKAGNSNKIYSKVVVDNTNPQVTLISPNNGSVVNGINTISGSGIDNNVFSSLKLVIRKYGSNDSVDYGTKTGNSASWSWDTAKLSDGEYVLSLTGTDSAGNSSTAHVNVKVANIPTGMGNDHWGTVDNKYGDVNIANGNYVITQKDISLPGRGLDVELARSYNTQIKTNGVLGWGWRLSIPELAQFSDGSIVITEGDGTKQLYTLNADGTYKRPTGVFVTLTKNNDDTFTWKFKNGNRYIFDNLNRKIIYIDKNDNSVVYTYDANNRLTNITDPTQRVITLSYDQSSGKLTSVTDYGNRTWNYNYDVNGNLNQVTGPAGYKYSFAYDTNHQINSITDANNNITTFSYSGDKLISINEPLSKTNSYTYDTTNSKFTEKDPKGNSTTYTYDSNWNILTLTDALNTITSNIYDANYNITKKTVKSASLVTKEFNYTYDTMGNILTEIDPELHTKTYVYDSNNNVTSITDPVKSMTFTYDTKGNLLTDTFNNLTYTYNTDGTLKTKSDAKGTINFSYDINGNLIEIKDSYGKTTKYLYDALGNKTSETDPSNNTTSYTYDNLGRILTVTVPAGPNVTNTTTYQYDADGNRTKLIDSFKNETTWLYDALNRNTTLTEPGNMVKTTAYDLNNNITSTKDPDMKETKYQYDVLDRQTRIDYPDGKFVTYEYDGFGNKTRMVDSTGTTDYEYNLDNNLTKETKNGKSTTYTYDGGHRLTGKTYNGKNVTYNLDNKDNLTSIINSSTGQTTNFTNDANKNRTATNYANNAKINYSYDNNNRLSNIKNLGPTDNVLSNFDYTYYDNSQIKTITDSNGTTTYTYDGQNRLVKIQDPTGKITAYTYDAVGNRSSMVNIINGVSSTTTYSYDLFTQELNYLVKPDNSSVSYTYDPNGSTLTRTDSAGTTYYEYSPEHQLTKVKKPNGDIITFTYDGHNQRTQKSVNGVITNYEYNGDLLVSEIDANGNAIATYSYDNKGVPISVTKGGQTYNYHYNGHGDVVALTDASGNVVATYAYDVWGNVTAQTGTIDTPFGYAGQHGYVYDKETGLYFLQSRYYNPEIGRFTTRDRFMGFEDVPASHNPFTYCENDPVNKVDPDGDFAIAFALMLAGDASFIPVAGWIAAAVILTGVAIYEGYNIYKDYQTSTKKKSASLPKEGGPSNGSLDLHNSKGKLKQRRFYDENGNALKDVDYEHGGVNHKFPHIHDWVNGKRNKNSRSPKKGEKI